MLCKHCGEEISEKHTLCPYCLKSQDDEVKIKKVKPKKEIIQEQKKESKLKKEFHINDNFFFSFLDKYELYIYIGILLLSVLLFLVLPIVYFNYYPNNSFIDIKDFKTYNIEMINPLNGWRLIFGYKTGGDTIAFNFLNLIFIILPIINFIFRKKIFSLIFPFIQIIILFLTRIISFTKDIGFISSNLCGYEVIYAFGFFILLVLLLISLFMQFYYYWRKKYGDNM